MPLLAESPYIDVHPSMAMQELQISETARARHALEALCAELFDTNELRRWADRNLPAELVLKLPQNTSPADLFSEFGELLARHGLVDEVSARLLQLREERRTDGERHLRTGSVHVRTVWHQRYASCLRLTLVCAAAWLLAHGYPSLDASKFLRSVETSVFVFLPLSYKHIGFPALICVTAACTALLWAVARNATRRS